MPLPVADPTLPPIVFLNTSLLGCPASIQALLALHIEFYPYYVVTSTNGLSRDQAVDALTADGVAFVAESLHEVWSLTSDDAVRPDERIAAWARQQPSPRSPFSYLLIEDVWLQAELGETHLAEYSVFCCAEGGFDDEGLARARFILRTQIPVAHASKVERNR